MKQECQKQVHYNWRKYYAVGVGIFSHAEDEKAVVVGSAKVLNKLSDIFFVN